MWSEPVLLPIAALYETKAIIDSLVWFYLTESWTHEHVIWVVEVDGRWLVADGNHRLRAAIRSGEHHVWARLQGAHDVC